MKKLISLLLILTTFAFSCSQSSEEKISEPTFAIEKHTDGSLRAVGELVNGEKHGEWSFFVNDRLSAIIFFENGLKNGKETWFDRCSGRIIEQGDNQRGQPFGLWFRYSNGVLKSIKEYHGDSSNYIYKNDIDDDLEIPPSPSSEEHSDCL
ncbi:MAG: hypothetical protein JJ978_07810 [Roseivirga sp.]|uniref:toxin-antitoxin system YwqK family antitoxin n=1 Tax=Roseivirga sp. TaxID=1964215 RepID=UPI001B2C5867|nr:hypothetical protein [Roseivirga sp.]MBO6495454.1 hypothetical protein [Roseivirga sp.]